MRIIFWIFMGCAISSHAFGEDPIQQRLDQLYAEYEATIANPTVKKYVELDGKLRAFLSEELPKYSEDSEGYSKYDGHTLVVGIETRKKFSNNSARELGLEISRYVPILLYSGKILVQAHELNPYSKYREYTLFSQIMSTNGLEMPDIKVAYQYARAFPNGPFIANVYLIIASFHKDLFMIVRGLSQGENVFGLYCYKPYVERRPYKEQMAQNKRIALRYYTKYKEALASGAKRALWFADSILFSDRIIDKLNAGTVEAWSFCAD